MIDIHAHILPGVDDGARDLYDTLEMVRMAADCGVTSMIATPHCNYPGVYENYFGKEYIEVFERVRNAVQKERIPVRILPGMEVFSTRDLPDLIVGGKIMPLNQSRYILMEFAFDEDPDYACDILRRVAAVGAKPVIAHVERYEFVQDSPGIVYKWNQKGYLIQVNKGSFTGRFGRRARQTAFRLMDHELVSIAASDAHRPNQRTPYMLDAYEALQDQYPVNYLKAIFERNPRCVCENQPVRNSVARPFTGR